MTTGTTTIFDVIAPFNSTINLSQTGTLAPGHYTFSVSLDAITQELSDIGSARAMGNFTFALNRPPATPTPLPVATHFVVSAPSAVFAGDPFGFTVTAQDQFNNTATTYPGTVHFTSSDPGASLPFDSTLTNGTGSFEVELNTLGSQTITTRDTNDSSITGTSNPISVVKNSPAPPTPTPTPAPTPTPGPTGTPLPTPCGVTFSENFDAVTAPSLPTGWTTTATWSSQLLGKLPRPISSAHLTMCGRSRVHRYRRDCIGNSH